jgi:hypothetical protein
VEEACVDEATDEDVVVESTAVGTIEGAAAGRVLRGVLMGRKQ